MLAIGIGVLLGTMNVYLRDVGEVVAVVLPIWFWLTPVIYTVDILPGYARDLVLLNPMAGLVSGYRDVFLAGEYPQWSRVVYPLALAFAMLALGLGFFRSRASLLADEL